MDPDDTFRDLLGLDLPPERLSEVLAAYRDILDGIRALRALDLTDVHPAVVVEPTAPDRRGDGDAGTRSGPAPSNRSRLTSAAAGSRPST